MNTLIELKSDIKVISNLCKILILTGKFIYYLLIVLFCISTVNSIYHLATQPSYELVIRNCTTEESLYQRDSLRFYEDTYGLNLGSNDILCTIEEYREV